jgi:hypothetical protein
MTSDKSVAVLCVAAAIVDAPSSTRARPSFDIRALLNASTAFASANVRAIRLKFLDRPSYLSRLFQDSAGHQENQCIKGGKEEPELFLIFNGTTICIRFLGNFLSVG